MSLADPSRRDTRTAILDAAEEIVARMGVGNLTFEEIAREAGVGAGTLYRHFPSRDALLAAALRDRQAELLVVAREARDVADTDAALARWLQALQDYLRTFNGLPAPVLAAVKEQASPLALSCDTLISITAEFLARAQREGHARASVSANDLFLAAIGIAWVLKRADACGTSPEALNAIFAHGYLDSYSDGRSVEDCKPKEAVNG